ncbi:MAG: hypothetical protein JKY51_07670 [Opitutaceae bacterium]|nr:hypothetical protein [Opitutaceae bacterium]
MKREIIDEGSRVLPVLYGVLFAALMVGSLVYAHNFFSGPEVSFGVEPVVAVIHK